MVSNIKADIKTSGSAANFIDKLYQYAVFVVLSMVFLYINYRMYIPGITINSHELNGTLHIASVLLIIVELLLFYKYVLCKISDRVNMIGSIFLLCVLLTFVILILMYYRVTPSWDFGDVMQGAYNIANGQPIAFKEYFEIYPHNLNPAIFLGLLIRLFGKGYWAPYVINAIFIMSSAIISYLLARRILGPKLSTLVPLFFLFSTPVYLYAPIVYTDTLSMPFPVLTVLFWVMARSSKTKTFSKFYIYYFLIGLASAFGYLFKPVAAIGLFAAIFETFLREKRFDFDADIKTLVSALSRRILPAVLSIAVFSGTLLLFGMYKTSHEYDRGIPTNKTYPFTHWLMLGINKPIEEGGTSYGYGGFSHEDFFYTKSLPTYELKKSETTRIFLQRMKEMGPVGYGRFLLKKLESVWNDGTFFVLVKLQREPLNTEPNMILGGTGVSNRPYLILAQLTHSTILFLMLVIFVAALRGRCNPVSRMLGAMCLGVMVFLFFWEARSRYIVTLIPIFIILASGGVGLLGGMEYKKDDKKNDN